jgi:hypothetical protein
LKPAAEQQKFLEFRESLINPRGWVNDPRNRRGSMKYLRLAPDASLLIVMLATSAPAGEILFPGLKSATPTRSAIEMPGAGVAATDLVTEIALNLVQSVLSLFSLILSNDRV